MKDFWFDPYNKAHIEAYHYYVRNLEWPEYEFAERGEQKISDFEKTMDLGKVHLVMAQAWVYEFEAGLL